MSIILESEIEKVDFTKECELNNILAKCGEIFMQSNQRKELFVFLCTLCNKKFDTIIEYSYHIEDFHILVDEGTEVEEDNQVITTIEEDNDVTCGTMQHHFELETCKTEGDNVVNKHYNDVDYENLIETQSDGSASECSQFTSFYENPAETTPTIILLKEDGIKEFKPSNRSKRKEKTIHVLHQCTNCSKSFKRKSNLKTHEFSHQLVKPFACSKCSATFANKQNLIIHVRRHTGQKPFHCSLCDKTFVSSTELNSHLRSHTGERPYICEDCGNAYTTSSQLLEHRKQHTGERRYKCEKCQKTFRTSAHLRSHANAVHANLPRSFSCKYCESRFKTPLALYQHSKIHAKEKPYKCRICGKAFAQHPGLYAHLKTHAKMMVQ